MKEIEQLKLDKDLAAHIPSLEEDYKNWTQEEYQDRIIIMKSLIEERKEKLDEAIKTKEMFDKNPRLAEAPFEFMKTNEYAIMKKGKHLAEFDAKIADHKRVLELQELELVFCNEKIEKVE